MTTKTMINRPVPTVDEDDGDEYFGCTACSSAVRLRVFTTKQALLILWAGNGSVLSGILTGVERKVQLTRR